LLQIEGALDVGSAHELAATLASLATETWPPILIDLSSLRLIDRAGASVLVTFCKQVRARGGAIHVIGLRQQPLAIFQLLRLDHYLCAHAPTEHAAVAA
jgi:anti-sigma B factor antagonist